MLDIARCPGADHRRRLRRHALLGARQHDGRAAHPAGARARPHLPQPAAASASGSGASNEPRRATVLTFVIAQACILLGDLNAIAPIITMFFMITYGTINLACFYESITGNPSYRPRLPLQPLVERAARRDRLRRGRCS